MVSNTMHFEYSGVNEKEIDDDDEKEEGINNCIK